MRTYFIAVWLGLLSVALSPSLSVSAEKWAVLGGLAAVLLPFFIYIDAFQLNAPGGTEHFWTTRPISRSVMVWSKIILFFVACVLPLLPVLMLANVSQSFALGEVCKSGLLVSLGFGGMCALISTCTRSPIQFIGIFMALLCLFIATVTLGEYVRGHFLHHFFNIHKPLLTFGLYGAAACGAVFARDLRCVWKTYGFILGATVCCRLSLSF